MKQFLTKLKRLTLLFAILGFANATQAQTYQLYFTNVQTPDTKTVVWDVYLLRTGATPLELATIQFGFGYDISILNGGTLTAAIDAGFSDLPAAMQPTTINVGVPSFTGAPVPAGQTDRYINVAAKAAPGPGNGAIISNVDNGCGQRGTRIGRFRITNSVAFTPNSHMNHVFSTAVASGRTKTQINAYVGTTNTNITVDANHFNYNVASTCDLNVTLNPVVTCAVTGVGTPSNVSCFGGTDGSVSVLLSGVGSGAPGTYSLDGGPATPYTANPFVVSGLSAGAHSIVATVTAGGCVSTPINFTVGSPAVLSANAVGGTVTCFGGTDGSATVTVSGGNTQSPGTYSLDGGSSQPYNTNPFTISGLAAGSHTVVVSAGGCNAASAGFSVATPTALTANAVASPASCAGNNDGSASVTVSGGNTQSPGTYSLDGGPATAYNTNPFTISALSPGSHTVTVSAGGCTSASAGFTVSSPAVFAGTGTTTPVTCGGGNTGTATITLTGGNTQAPGTYSLDGGSPTAYSTNPFTINALSAGNHSIVVTSGACTTAAILVNVGANATFTATYTKTNLSSCSGTPNGTISVTPSGGSGNYTYSWTGNTGSGNPAPQNFTAGNVSSLTGLNYGFYNVTITDVGGCGTVTINNIHVEFAFTVVVSYSGTSASACGNTGSVTLYGNSGIQPYTYSLNGTTYQPSNTFTGLAAGSYTGYIKDAGGCVGTKSITVSAAAAITVNPFVRNASSCAPDGSVEVYRTGGTPPYTYSKDNGATYQASNLFSGLAAGSYTIKVKDAAGCTGTATAVVGAGTGLTVSTSKVNTSICQNDGSIQVTASGGVGPYTYSKDNGTTFQASNSFSGLGAGNYAIVVKDTKGCLGGPNNVTINLNSIVVTASVVNATTCVSNNGQIQLFRTGGTGPYTYSIDGNTYQTSPVFTGVAAGTYTGFVKDSKTCIGALNNIVVGPTGCPGSLVATNPNTKGATNTKVNPNTTAELKIQAYPNPSTTEFTLVLQGYDATQKVSITITDVLGRKVYQTEGTGKQQYKIGRGFIAGIYNVQVIQGTDKKSLKLVKE